MTVSCLLLETYKDNNELVINRFSNIVSKAVDFIGYSLYEGAKASIEYGYNNPEIDWEKVKDLIIMIFWIILGFTLLRNFPYIIAVFYVIYIFIINLYKYIKKRNKLPKR